MQTETQTNLSWLDQVITSFPNAQLFKLKGYSEMNESGEYNDAKTPCNMGWNTPEFKGTPDKLIHAWVKELYNGWIGFKIPEGYILLDVDKKHNVNAPELMANLLKGENIKCHHIVTPNGRQMIFKAPQTEMKQGAKMYTPLGIVIDTRVHGKGYTVYPTPNTEGRYVEQWCDGELDVFPTWLQTMWNVDKLPDGQDLPNYPIGDGGRNDFMFKWACKIASQGQSKEQVREVLHLINKYLVNPSLDAQEVDSCVKQAFQDRYVEVREQKHLEWEMNNKGADWWVMNNKGTLVFKHHIMAKHIKQHFNVIRYGDESGILYYYDNNEGFYKMDANLYLLNQTIRTLDETLTIQQVREVVMAIYTTSPIVKQWDRTHIPVKNGLWDIEQKKLVPFAGDVFIDYKIDINYNPFAHSDFIDKTLSKLSNYHAPTRKNLEECLGSIVSPELLTRYIWFLFGRTAHNGKSFFGFLIQLLIGQEYVSTLSPHDVARSQFKIAEMYGKKVNYVDETGEKAIPDFDKIKILATGGQTTVEFKGKNGFSVQLEVPQVWCSNFFPNIKEEGNQVDRRFEIIPFDWDFKNDPERLADYVAERMASTDESKEYLLKLAIDGMYRLMENNGEPSPNEKRNEQKQEFKDNNDKLGEWLDTVHLIANEQGCYNMIDIESFNDIYRNYTTWCERNEEKFPYGKARFNNELMKRFNLKRTKKRLLDMGSGKEAGNPVQRYVINE
jgi:P4 family phage/plasmid primase-like protien